MARQCFGEAELANLREVIASQELWRGTGDGFASRLERVFAERHGRAFCQGVSSGTAANETGLFALGLQPGDEVICPASAPAFVSLPVVAIGCVPVFADTDERTLIISPEGLEAAITPRAKAVMVVHLNGQPAPMDDLLPVARRHGLKVLEDCAQCYDGWHKGRRTGTMGDIACFSLQQSKHITSGEGGLVLTDDPDAYRRAVSFANSGLAWYNFGLERPTAVPVAGVRTRGHFTFGHNYRLSELAAAVALAQLEKIDTLSAWRAESVAAILEAIHGVAGVEPAYIYPGTVPNYWVYPVRVPDGFGTFAEVNYVEPVFQQMQEQRHTSLGVPLPDYVQYRPGLCPHAEAGARKLRGINVNPVADVDTVREQARALCAAVTAGQ